MRKLLLFLVILLSAQTASAAWSQRHFNAGTPTGSNPFTLTVTSSTAGDLIVVWYGSGANVANCITSVSDNASGGTNSYTVETGTSVNVSSAGSGEFAWSLTARGSVTSVIATVNVSCSSPVMIVWQISGIAASPKDAANTNTFSASTIPIGATVTTTQTGDYIVAAMVTTGTVTGMCTSGCTGTDGSAWTSDSTTGGDGYAHVTSTSAAATTWQPQWAQSSGNGAAATIAFKATGTAVVTRGKAVIF
jgi:hypothetical protein